MFALHWNHLQINLPFDLAEMKTQKQSAETQRSRANVQDGPHCLHGTA